MSEPWSEEAMKKRVDAMVESSKDKPWQFGLIGDSEARLEVSIDGCIAQMKQHGILPGNKAEAEKAVTLRAGLVLREILPGLLAELPDGWWIPCDGHDWAPDKRTGGNICTKCSAYDWMQE